MFSRLHEPAVVVDAPPAILTLASIDSRILINSRPDQWHDTVLQRFKYDKQWKNAIGRFEGALVSPELTDFILDVRPGTSLAISFQGWSGDIHTQVGTLYEIRTKEMQGEIYYGMNAAIRLAERKHLHPSIGETWCSFVLAIAKLPDNARPAMRFDPDGSTFVSTLRQ
jgi:hypothetical protein